MAEQQLRDRVKEQLFRSNEFKIWAFGVFATLTLCAGTTLWYNIDKYAQNAGWIPTALPTATATPPAPLIPENDCYVQQPPYFKPEKVSKNATVTMYGQPGAICNGGWKIQRGSRINHISTVLSTDGTLTYINYDSQTGVWESRPIGNGPAVSIDVEVDQHHDIIVFTRSDRKYHPIPPTPTPTSTPTSTPTRTPTPTPTPKPIIPPEVTQTVTSNVEKIAQATLIIFGLVTGGLIAFKLKVRNEQFLDKVRQELADLHLKDVETERDRLSRDKARRIDDLVKKHTKDLLDANHQFIREVIYNQDELEAGIREIMRGDRIP